MIDPRVLRAQLEDDLEALRARHERLSAHLRNEDREVPADWTERAQFTENDKVLEALEVRTLNHIRQIQRTMRIPHLVRLDLVGVDPSWISAADPPD